MSVAEHYRDWFQRLPRQPAAQLAPAHAAVDAFEAVEHQHTITHADLVPLVEAARSPYTAVNGTGCNLVIQLAPQHAAARQCLVQLARDKKAAVRYTVVFYLGGVLDEEFYLPEALRREIVELALGDRSSLVRRTAVEKAELFQFKDLLPRLETMQQTEANHDVLETLAKHIALLRDGFVVNRDEDGDYFIWVRQAGGGLSGRTIPKENYSEKFVRKLAAKVRAEE